MIVVLDASTFVSAALKADSIAERALRHAIANPNQLVVSSAVTEEYREVIFRPKFDRYISVERRRLILDVVIAGAIRMDPTEFIQECADPKDDKYLALAAAGSADVIISSDIRHLLVMHPWRGIPILSPTDYLAMA